MGCGNSQPSPETQTETKKMEQDKFQWEDDNPAELREPVKPPPNFNRNRKRQSVSAECFTPGAHKVENPVYPKSDAEAASIMSRLSKNVLFKVLDEEQTKTIVLAVKKMEFPAGAEIIKQGDKVAESFYIMEKGECEALVNGTSVKLYSEEGAFGELALLYNAPRAATVVAKTDAIVWALDRNTFRNIVIVSNAERRRTYEEFLQSVPLLKNLDANERSAIADVLEPQYFDPGTVIIKEGDEGDYFYLLEEGEVKAEASSVAGGLITYSKPGDYFGELALLTNEPRKATCTALKRSKIAAIDRDSFNRLLGRMEELLGRNEGEYKKWMAEANLPMA